jgi:ferrous iron transport protein A
MASLANLANEKLYDIVRRRDTNMTLAEVDQDQTAKIVMIGGGSNMRQQLRELGLYPGDIVRVLRRAAFQGPLLIESRGTQIAIGRAIAERVQVE